MHPPIMVISLHLLPSTLVFIIPFHLLIVPGCHPKALARPCCRHHFPFPQSSLSFSSVTDEKGRKPRPAPDLPTCFEGILNEKNIFSLTTVGEANYTDKKTGKTRGPFHIAMHIKVPGNDRKEINFEFAELTVDNLRALVKTLGIKGYASGSKF
jgi:hypothetical protein